MAEKLSAEDKRDIIAEAIDRHSICLKSCNEIRNDMVDDLEFCVGKNHWTPQELADRKGRPNLVINRIPTYVNQVVNDARQTTPAIKLRPTEDADKDTTEVYQGLVRRIQNNGNSKAAVDTAFGYAVRGSIGWFRILPKYCNNNSFEQELEFARIKNPLSVLAPLHLCKEADFSDMPYCFVVDRIPKDEYERQYPEVPVADFQSTAGGTDWVTDDGVLIAEYFVIKNSKEKKIYLLEDGNTVEKLPEGVKPVKTRTVHDKEVHWYKLSAGDVLEHTTFPGKYIPLIPITGDQVNVDGKDYYISLTRNAKDAQRAINYYKSCKAERIGLAPKAPYIAAAGQIEKYKDIWALANKENIAVLPYEPQAVGGQLLPAPQRTGSIQADAGLIEAEREAIDDLKAVTGIFDASLGAKGNETSGKAILARQREGDNANFHFTDSLGYALKHAGKILVDIIPDYYDTPRMIAILGDDMKEKIVRINQTYVDEKTRKEKKIDMTAGTYDVEVDIGPSYQTKRVETAETLLEILRALPAIGEVTTDIWARNMDFQGADEFAQRIKKLIEMKFPGLTEDAEINVDEQQLKAVVMDLQKVMMQFEAASKENAQLKAVIGELDAVVQKMQNELDDKSADIQTKRDTAVLNNATKLKQTEMQISAKQMENFANAINTLVSKVDSLEQRNNSPAPAQNAG